MLARVAMGLRTTLVAATAAAASPRSVGVSVGARPSPSPGPLTLALALTPSALTLGMPLQQTRWLGSGKRKPTRERVRVSRAAALVKARWSAHPPKPVARLPPPGIVAGDVMEVVDEAHPDFGRRGKVMRVFPKLNSILVSGLTLRWAPVKVPVTPKPSQMEMRGRYQREREKTFKFKDVPLPYDAVQLIDPVDNKPTPVRVERLGENGKTRRVAVRSGVVISKPPSFEVRRQAALKRRLKGLPAPMNVDTDTPPDVAHAVTFVPPWFTPEKAKAAIKQVKGRVATSSDMVLWMKHKTDLDASAAPSTEPVRATPTATSTSPSSSSASGASPASQPKFGEFDARPVRKLHAEKATHLSARRQAPRNPLASKKDASSSSSSAAAKRASQW